MARIDTLTNFFTDVADSIRSKTGKTDPIPCEDFDTEIESIETGGGDEEKKSVLFYDYDGTLVYSYTPSEFLKLNSLPENPTHSGLTAQGWNWSLEDAKEYLNYCSCLEIGQMYKTDDDTLRIYIDIPYDDFTAYFGGISGKGGTLTVDWGDGSTEAVSYGTSGFTYNKTHTYTTKGNYIIKYYNENITNVAIFGNSAVTSTRFINTNSSGSSATQLERSYAKLITKIELPGWISSLGACAFSQCYRVQYVPMPYGITQVPHYAFMSTNLKTIVIPNSVTLIGAKTTPAMAYAGVVYGVIEHFILPNSIKEIGTYSFYGSGDTLLHLNLPINIETLGTSWYSAPNNVKKETPNVNNTTLTLPQSMINGIVDSAKYMLSPWRGVKLITNFEEYCIAKKRVQISILEGFVNIDDITLTSTDITSIGDYAFKGCTHLRNVQIPSSITSIGSAAFSGCYNLEYVNIEDTNITTIATDLFRECRVLDDIVLPNTVTTIGQFAFYNCYCLSNITLPNTITSIGGSAFYGCRSMQHINLEDTTITTIPTSAFNSCLSLTVVKMPKTVTSIADSAFSGCKLELVDFTKHESIPSLSNYSRSLGTFVNQKTQKILVPQSLYTDWIAASQWSKIADYIYAVDENGNILPKE